jgi:hypothetical protein
MAGARALWRATGMKDGDFGKPIIAVANSFTQFVPGHVHLKDLGQLVAREIEAAGGVAKEFNTIAVDDGIAMGHGGMLYSLPSREIIADSVEYMVNAHCADALVCISNCDKITPGMLMAAMRLNIPAVFVSGGPMEAGKVQLRGRWSTSTWSTRWCRPPIPMPPTKRWPRALRLPDLRFLLRHVHGQLDELPDRGAGPFAARQRFAARNPCGPQGPVPGGRAAGRPTRPALLRAGRCLGAAAIDRQLPGFRERHEPGYRDGWVDQYRAAPAGRCPGRRSRLHHGRHRPPLAAGAEPLQGCAGHAEVPHGRRAPGRRRDRDPRRTGSWRTDPSGRAHRAQCDAWKRTGSLGRGACGGRRGPDALPRRPGAVSRRRSLSHRTRCGTIWMWIA